MNRIKIQDNMSVLPKDWHLQKVTLNLMKDREV